LALAVATGSSTAGVDPKDRRLLSFAFFSWHGRLAHAFPRKRLRIGETRLD
jgi:hypothetical protein